MKEDPKDYFLHNHQDYRSDRRPGRKAQLTRIHPRSNMERKKCHDWVIEASLKDTSDSEQNDSDQEEETQPPSPSPIKRKTPTKTPTPTPSSSPSPPPAKEKEKESQIFPSNYSLPKRVLESAPSLSESLDPSTLERFMVNQDQVLTQLTLDDLDRLYEEEEEKLEAELEELQEDSDRENS